MSRQLWVHLLRLRALRSCHEYLTEVMKLLVDVCRIRNGACYFHPQCFPVTLTQTRKPGTQSGNRHSESSGGFLLIWQRDSSTCNERSEHFKLFRFALRLK